MEKIANAGWYNINYNATFDGDIALLFLDKCIPPDKFEGVKLATPGSHVDLPGRATVTSYGHGDQAGHSASLWGCGQHKECDTRVGEIFNAIHNVEDGDLGVLQAGSMRLASACQVDHVYADYKRRLHRAVYDHPPAQADPQAQAEAAEMMERWEHASRSDSSNPSTTLIPPDQFVYLWSRVGSVCFGSALIQLLPSP